jgi:hypothetical protein
MPECQRTAGLSACDLTRPGDFYGEHRLPAEDFRRDGDCFARRPFPVARH